MSAYSMSDIEEAFECKDHNPECDLPITRARVITHLEGNCACDLRRCEKCGARPRNNITNHREDCPWR